MTRLPVLRLLFLSVLTLTLTAQQRTRSESAARVTPARVEAGSPEVIAVSAPTATSVEGEWLGHKLEFFHHGQEWVALAGVDVETNPQTSTLHITAQSA